jgi:hypothetical protein
MVASRTAAGIARKLGNLCEDNNSITSALSLHPLILAKVLIEGDIFHLDKIPGKFDYVLAEAILSMQSNQGKAKLLAAIHKHITWLVKNRLHVE